MRATSLEWGTPCRVAILGTDETAARPNGNSALLEFFCTFGKVAICSYILSMASTGIRDLKDNLSRYIRRVEAGERIAITAHGRVVAELVPPGNAGKDRGPSRFDELVAAGVIRPPLESGDPTEDWPDIRLPPGAATELIDADRGEA